MEARASKTWVTKLELGNQQNKSQLQPKETLMSRKDESILNMLFELPWYWSVGLSVFAYVTLKWLLPAIPFSHPIQQAFVNGMSRIAYLVALVLLLPAPLSLFRSFMAQQRKREKGRIKR